MGDNHKYTAVQWHGIFGSHNDPIWTVHIYVHKKHQIPESIFSRQLLHN